MIFLAAALVSALAAPVLASAATVPVTRLVLASASLGAEARAGAFAGEPALLPDAYAELTAGGVKVCETEVAVDTFEPVWQQPCSLRVAPAAELRLEVRSFAPEGDRLLGTWVGTLRDLGAARGPLAFGTVRSFRVAVE